MIDEYENRRKQVAILLNYDEPQILELFKNSLPSRLYWVLFSINNFDRCSRCSQKSAGKREDRQTTIRSVMHNNSIYEGRRHSSFK